MHKNTSISLHLAKVIGLQNIHTAHEQYQVGERVTHELTDIRREIFNPFANRAQWADVALWYVRREAMLHLTYLSARCPATETEIGCSNSDESRMAATLEAIALATGWTE